ncbi:hypothetical protein [Mesorhizobium sp. RMAD-H1]|uniref:hypothetical protein n=1 Tax=Mesorhizobium sp. RMAD-H1 TaxID=2587065 RepID=UPI00162051F8|nr:hypothetical protein [Mesorhizobium sp. RMAD-H1]MBB2973938.1 hypothetical protein [Mesorhizobium sp. RMAD-H1]
MTDQEIADLLAAQTALISVLFEELFKAGISDRREVVNRLYDLLEEQNAGKPPSNRSAPIRHLISILEK